MEPPIKDISEVDLILDKILFHTATRDLTRTRLVCKSWWLTATRECRRRDCFEICVMYRPDMHQAMMNSRISKDPKVLNFGQYLWMAKAGESERVRRDLFGQNRRLETLHECAKKSFQILQPNDDLSKETSLNSIKFPWTRIFLEGGDFSDPVVQEFLSLFGQSIKTLHLSSIKLQFLAHQKQFHGNKTTGKVTLIRLLTEDAPNVENLWVGGFTRNNWEDGKNEYKNLNLPTLRTLTLDPDPQYSVELGCSLLKGAKNLKLVSNVSAPYAKILMTLPHPLPTINNILLVGESGCHGNNPEELAMLQPAKLVKIQFAHVGGMDVELDKKMANILNVLLEGCQETLSHFESHGFSINFPANAIPPLKNLKILSLNVLKGHLFGLPLSLKRTSVFPVVQKLVMGIEVGGMMQVAMGHFPSVTSLEIQDSRALSLLPLCPGVRELKLNCFTRHETFTHQNQMGQCETLVTLLTKFYLQASTMTNCLLERVEFKLDVTLPGFWQAIWDVALTGISIGKVATVSKKISKWTHPNCGRRLDVENVRTAPWIGVVDGLKCLQFSFVNTTWIPDRRSINLTAVSALCAFQLMSSDLKVILIHDHGSSDEFVRLLNLDSIAPYVTIAQTL